MKKIVSTDFQGQRFLIEIQEHISKITEANNATAKTIPVGGMELSSAVTILKGMFLDPVKGGPYIEAHPNGTGVLVRGKKDQVADVELAIKNGLQEGGEGISGSGNIQIINLKEGSGAMMAEALQRMLKQMGKGDLRSKSSARTACQFRKRFHRLPMFRPCLRRKRAKGRRRNRKRHPPNFRRKIFERLANFVRNVGVSFGTFD